MKRSCLALAGALALAPATASERVTVVIDESLAFQGEEVGYRLDLAFSVVSPTRIGVQAMLDLRDLQRRLPTLLLGVPILDNCGARVTIQWMEAEGRGTMVTTSARLAYELFTCERTGPAEWRRGATERAGQAEFRADLSADLRGTCVVFRLLDLTAETPGALGQVEIGSGRREAALALMVEAIDLLLQDTPLCPELPEILLLMKPELEDGAPVEIGDGGLGVAVSGSADVGPSTVLRILRWLQEQDVLPSPP